MNNLKQMMKPFLHLLSIFAAHFLINYYHCCPLKIAKRSLK